MEEGCRGLGESRIQVARYLARVIAAPIVFGIRHLLYVSAGVQ
jgi:hypothetical protein